MDIRGPVLRGTAGKGGGASLLSRKTWKRASADYFVEDHYSISATDYNYISHSTKKTFTWGVNSKIDKFLNKECRVYNH